MNRQVIEEAGEWVVLHREIGLDPAQRVAFDRWLRESPNHVRAYLEMSSLWEELSSADLPSAPDAQALVASANEGGEVVPLPLSRSAVPSTPVSAAAAVTALPRRRRLRHAGLAAALLVLALGAWLNLQRGTYSTDIGQQRSIALADGSLIELNARSRVRVRYNANERGIRLLEGQALFRAAKNPLRPFVVETSDARVVAVGTAFDVRTGPAGTVVTVVEGRVAVHNEAASPLGQGMNAMAMLEQDSARPEPGVRAILLDAGQKLVVNAQAVPVPTAANVAAIIAWTRHSLVFENATLPEVAEEFNRYSARPLVLVDPRLAGFRVSGVFSAAEPTLLLHFLQAQPELLVEESAAEILVRSR